MSRFEHLIVDLRPLSVVTPNHISVAPVPWSRGVDKNGDGKANLSANGTEINVLVIPKKICEQLSRTIAIGEAAE